MVQIQRTAFFLCVVIGLPICPLYGREQISLDSGWRFQLGDPGDVTTNVTYYPEISDLAKLDANENGAGNNTETYMESIRVDIFATHAGENVSFVQTNYDDSAWRQINLPHDWAVELPFSSSADSGHGYKSGITGSTTTNTIGWYRHTFALPSNYAGQSLWLQFDGVYRNCLVWFNGHIIGRNVSGYESFYFDVTPYANPGGTNVLVVRVDASRFEGWFYEGAGIYRHVWLTAENPLHVSQWGTYAATTSLDLVSSNATVTVQTEVTNQSGVATVNGSVTSLILDANSNTVATTTSLLNLSAGQGSTLSQAVSFSANLWSPQTPYLYRLVTTISNQNAVADVYYTTFGVRSVAFDATNGLFLNGQRIFVQGMSVHQDHAGVGSAVPDRLQYYRIERLKEMGVTGYRTAHNEPASEILDACDQSGMLVLDENRRFGTNAEPLSQLSRLIRRDRNHPSVFAWSLCNEETAWQGDTSGTGASLIQVMQNLVHSLDPWRKCTAAVNFGWNSGFATVLDIEGLNYEKYGNLDCLHRDAPALPAMGTEVGDISTTRGKYYVDMANGYVPAYDAVLYQGDYGFGYTANFGQFAEKWWPRYNFGHPWLGGGFNWTGFDYRGEETPYGWPCVNSASGILDTCGFFKDLAYYYQANWTVKPILHLFPHWNWAAGTNVNVWAFGNCDSVELFTNGVSLGRKLLNTQNHVEWNVPWASGTVKAIGYSHLAPVITNSWTTSLTPTAIALWPDRSTILADGRDVSVITVAVLDAQGNIVPTATNTVNFAVSGGGTIIGVGDGDPSSHESDKGTQRSVFNGLAQVIVQSTNVPGSITLTATSSGLPTTNITIIEAATLPPPAAPTGVAAVPGNARVTVSWDIVPGAITYNLWRAMTPGGLYSLVAANLGAVNLGYTDTGLANNIAYYYVVTANNANGTSVNSMEVSTTPSPMVSDLAALATNGAIQLTWSGLPGTTYNVKRSATCGGPYSIIATSISDTNYTDWAVAAGQTNYYIVTINNGGSESIPSNEAGAFVSNLPWPWSNADLGQVNLDGSASYSGGQFTISGSGRGIPDYQATGFDSFQFVYLYVPITTNGYIQARVASIQNTMATAKAGVMIRENFYADSRFAMVDVQSTIGTEFVRRTSTGGGTNATGASGTAPRWVRLARTNNTFYAYSSANGSTWAQIGSSVTISMATNAYVGLVVCSGHNGKLNTSTVDNVTSSFLPANTAPTLQAIPNQTVNVGQSPPVTANATDTNTPPSVLTFNLLNAPANAALTKINSTNAAFNWRPMTSDANTTNQVTLKVADNASPSLSATQSFLVVVSPLTPPTLSSPVWSNGQFSLLVTNGQSGPDYAVQASTNLFNWSTLWTTNSPSVPFSWADTNASDYPDRLYRLVVGPPLP